MDGHVHQLHGEIFDIDQLIDKWILEIQAFGSNMVKFAESLDDSGFLGVHGEDAADQEHQCCDDYDEDEKQKWEVCADEIHIFSPYALVGTLIRLRRWMKVSCKKLAYTEIHAALFRRMVEW